MTPVRFIFYIVCTLIIGTYVVSVATGLIAPPAELMGLR